MSQVPDAAGVAATPPTTLGARSIDESMDRFAAGDLAAFTEVYAATLPRVAHTLGRLTRQHAVAEDLAQETMLRVYQARTTWRPGAQVRPWANAIARRLFIDRIRRHRREQRAHNALSHRDSPWSGGHADAHLATRRKALALAASFERLPPRHREVLQLICLDGKSLAEAAAQLGETKLALRVRVHRARGALAAALAEH